MSHQPNFNGIRLSDIVQKKSANERIIPQDYLNALVNESKQYRNFENAEVVFGHFLDHLNRIQNRLYNNYTKNEVKVFQKIIITLTRFAPGPLKALDYTAYLLNEEPPLRTEHIEAKCLNNLILKYGKDASPDSMAKALRLIKIGLNRKIPAIQQDNVGQAFISMSRDVLSHHHLQLSQGMTTLEPK
jgi:hypothetical protein